MSGHEAPDGMVWGSIFLQLNVQEHEDGTITFDDEYVFGDIGLFVQFEDSNICECEEEAEEATQPESKPPSESGTTTNNRPTLPQTDTTIVAPALAGVILANLGGLVAIAKSKKK